MFGPNAGALFWPGQDREMLYRCRVFKVITDSLVRVLVLVLLGLLVGAIIIIIMQ